MKRFLNFLIFATCFLQVNSQSVDWQNVMCPPRRPSWGVNYTWNGDMPATYSESTITSGSDQTIEHSGEDWWYAHCNIYDSTGNQIGYAAAGYATYPNWGYQDSTGCFYSILHNETQNSNHPSPPELETRAWRKGPPRCWVGFFNLNGEKVWCRNYLGGVLYGVAQSNDGNIVAIGEASTNRMSTSTHNNQPVLKNGTEDISNIDCSNGLGLMQTKMVIMKVGLNGSVIWNNLYSNHDLLSEWWTSSAKGFSISPVQDGLYAVGSIRIDSLQGEYPWFVKISEGGSITGSHLYLNTESPMIDIGFELGNFIRPLDIDIRDNHAAISGQFRGSHNDAFLWYIDDVTQSPWSVSMTKNTNSLEGHETDLHQHSSGVAISSGGELIWPVLSDYDPSTDVYAGRSIATLKVHKISPAGSVIWTSNLGEVRAYDLQSDVTNLKSGDIAVVSSKWNFCNYESLPENVKNSLTDPEGLGYDIGADPFNWSESDVYEYWNTDAYVAVIRNEDGSKIWDVSVDSDPGVDPAPFPGNLKKQECMYKITESEDGGLVVSGNTGSNFDDAYLLKINPPQIDVSNLHLDMFPNPSSSNFSLNYNVGSVPSDLSITDLTGRIIYKSALKRPSDLLSIDCSRWGPGVYVVSLMGDKSISDKIIKY